MSFALGHDAEAAGYQLAAFDHTGSTNADALAAARQGNAEPTWFVTLEQRAGRGRRQRVWQAPRGNLACSVFEVLDASPAVAATLGFAAGIALRQALIHVSEHAYIREPGGAAAVFRLKWPNDILASGKKLVGILLEAESLPDNRLGVVVGMGVNIVAHPEGTDFVATSLSELGVHVTGEELFLALSDAWTECFRIWNGGAGFPELRRLWLEGAAGLGQPVAVNTGSDIIQGVFETIDDNGCLVIRTTENNVRTIAAGDVVFGVARSAGAL